MAKTAYINARVEQKLKTDAERVFRRVSVNTSDAVSMFLQQVVLQRGIPFEIRIPNAETQKAIIALRAGKGKVYTGDTKDILDRIEKER